ncbi:MAG: FG-GAP-like repeat-containing protein [Pyrinomonadaceae bacterium]
MKTSQIFLKRICNSLQILFALLLVSSAIYAAGEVDPTFNVAVQITTTGSVEKILVQADGKLLVVGNFTVADNTARSNIARLNADGTVDTTFNPPDFYKLSFGYLRTLTDVYIRAVAVQPDGKILVGGNFSGVNNTLQPRLARLNADGSLDSTFTTALTNDLQPDTNTIYDIKIQTDGKIIIGGNFSIIQSGTSRSEIARLNSDGSLDVSFGQAITSNPIVSLVIQPDGKTVFAASNATNGFVRRANLDGTIDASFPDVQFATPPSTQGGFAINRVVLQPDGKILVGGSFTSANGFQVKNITRLNTNGSIDPAFNSAGTSAVQNISRINGIAILPDGKIAIGGTFDYYGTQIRSKTARLNADGTLDTSYNNVLGGSAPESVTVNDVQSLGDGKIIRALTDPYGLREKIARINTDGTLDTTFTGTVYHRGAIYEILAQPDGKILVGGLFAKINGTAHANLARLNQDGSVDMSFVASSVANGGVTAISLQGDGKILVGSTAFGNNKLVRLNVDGSLDTTFNSQLSYGNFVIWIQEIAVLADGKIIVAGTLGAANGTNVQVARLTMTGAIDTTFLGTMVGGSGNAGGYTPITDLKIQSDGKIIIVGTFTTVNGANRGRIARLNADGTLDTTFNTALGANDTINNLAIQSNGSIVIGGNFLAVNGGAIGTRPYLARILSDGTFDNSFTTTANNSVQVLERQPDDKILVAGLFTQINGVTRNGLARLNADGTLDNSFTGNGVNDIIRDITLQPNNKILVGGEFTRLNGISAIGIARLLNNAAARRTQFDFDGDGRADISVFRPLTGFWYELRSQNSSFYALQFGASSDKIAPADYDGDGRTDIAVFRDTVPGAGNFAYFYITNSSDNSFRPVQFGATGDVPVSGDWDGDGKADLAVYRDGSLTSGQSYFYYRPSSVPGADFRSIAWGGTGDKPLVGDFDGDGKLDAAVFRPSTATWYILKSSNNQVIQTSFGLTTDIPVPADYDGDGSANIAVFRPSTGTWFTSTNPQINYGAVQFGANGDLPVPADYDGDGKADVAVFRPSTGAWYLQRSTSGFTGVSFGTAGDKPAPNAFIR